MKIFIAETPECGPESAMTIRTSDAARAAAIFIASAEKDRHIGEGFSSADIVRVRVQEIPAQTGTVQNFGALTSEVFMREFIDPVEVRSANEMFPAEPSNVLFVSVEDGNGDDWEYLVEASSPEKAQQIVMDLGEVENGIDAMYVQRMPSESGEEGIVRWDDRVPMPVAYSPEP